MPLTPGGGGGLTSIGSGWGCASLGVIVCDAGFRTRAEYKSLIVDLQQNLFLLDFSNLG